MNDDFYQYIMYIGEPHHDEQHSKMLYFFDSTISEDDLKIMM
jgi:hypothetical protein